MRHNAGVLFGEDAGVVKRTFTLPLAGVFISLYVLSTILFATKPQTYLIATGVGFTLAIVFLVEWMSRRRQLHVPVPLLWFAAFICFCTLQMIWAPGSVRILMTLAQLFVLACIIVNFEADDDSPMVEYAFYVAVICTFVYNFFSNEVPIGGRIGSTLENANGYAEVLMYGAILTLRRVLIESEKRQLSWKKIVPLVGFYGLTLYGVTFLTGSRKGIILTVVASLLVTWYWIWRQPAQYRILITIVAAAFFAGVGYLLYQSPQTERLVNIANLLEGRTVDHSLMLREGLVKEAMDYWLQRPFTGWGLGQFRELSSSSFYAHNNYAELLANGGIFAAIFYVMIYVSALASLMHSLWRAKSAALRADVVWAIIVVVVLIAWDFAAVSYYEKVSWIMLSVAIGVSVRARRITQAAQSRIEPWPSA
jgi:hypothetical protein